MGDGENEVRFCGLRLKRVIGRGEEKGAGEDGG